MRDLRALEHAGEGFRRLDGRGADQHGLPLGVGFLDFRDDGVELLAAGLEYLVVLVDADVRRVGRDRQHVEAVDVVELGGLGLGGASHAREFLIEAEIVLDGDGGEGLGFFLDGDVFLGFDGLVEAVRPAATGHFAAGVFIDDDDLVVLDHILDVLFKNAVGLEQLGDVMDLLGLEVHADLEGVLGRDFLFLGERAVGVNVGVEGAEVGQGEGFRISGGEEISAHFHEVRVVAFFIDDEIEFFFEFEEFLFLGILVEGEFGFFQQLAHFRVLHEAHELAVARLAELHFEEVAAGADGIAVFEQLLGLGGEVVAELGLLFHELLDERLVFVELVGRLGGRAGNDERGARLVDEDGVHFVDDGEVVAALDLLVLGGGHAVVAEVVEAELGVGAVGDVAGVFGAAFPGRHLVLDGADR